MAVNLIRRSAVLFAAVVSCTCFGCASGRILDESTLEYRHPAVRWVRSSGQSAALTTCAGYLMHINPPRLVSPVQIASNSFAGAAIIEGDRLIVREAPGGMMAVTATLGSPKTYTLDLATGEEDTANPKLEQADVPPLRFTIYERAPAYHYWVCVSDRYWIDCDYRTHELAILDQSVTPASRTVLLLHPDIAKPIKYLWDPARQLLLVFISKWAGQDHLVCIDMAMLDESANPPTASAVAVGTEGLPLFLNSALGR